MSGFMTTPEVGMRHMSPWPLVRAADREVRVVAEKPRREGWSSAPDSVHVRRRTQDQRPARDGGRGERHLSDDVLAQQLVVGVKPIPS